MALPGAVLFDLDDTILAYDGTVDACWRTVVGRYVGRISGCTDERLLDAIREIAAWYWGDPERHRRGRQNLPVSRLEIVTEVLHGLGCRDDALAAEMARDYSDLRESSVRPFPGAIETLEWLRCKGVPLALLTNGAGEPQRVKIDRFGLSRFIECILIEGELGAGKPDPLVFTAALDRLCVRPEDAWMVGDNLAFDIAGAQAVGICTIWVDWQGTGLPPSAAAVPDRTVRSIAEVDWVSLHT